MKSKTEQRSEWMPKVIKIYGPPGTGKTTTLISTLKTVLASGTPPTRVAYITHTKAAGEEVKERVADQLGLKQADMKWFRTIHSLCCGMCGIHYADIFGRQDEDDFHRDTGYYIAGGFDTEALEEYKPEDEGYDLVIFADQLAKATQEPLKDVIAAMPGSPKLIDPYPFLEAYDEWKQERGKLDFTDMLLEYDDSEYPSGDIDVVFVDEAQDLSKLQWDIVHKYAAKAEMLYIAGDDDQSIYKFLGADEYGFLDHPADEDIVLTKSYRVPQVVGEVSSNVIQKIERRKNKAVEWMDKPGEIKRYTLDEEFLPWKDWTSGDETVMVLCRHRRQMYEVRKMLNKMRVPHTLKGESMATSHLGKMIRVYLELFHNGTTFRPAVVAQMLKAIGKAKYGAEVQALGVSDRKIKLGMEELTIEYNTNWPALFGKQKWQLAQIDALRRQINEFGLEIIGPMPNIDISTYHGSKGREADHIVLFTDCYASTWAQQEENPDSEIRLAYVGLTRAKKTATIMVPRTNMYLRALI